MATESAGELLKGCVAAMGADVDDCMRRLAFSSGVSNSHGRVVTDEGDGISRGAESNTLDPAYNKHRLAVVS